MRIANKSVSQAYGAAFFGKSVVARFAFLVAVAGIGVTLVSSAAFAAEPQPVPASLAAPTPVAVSPPPPTIAPPSIAQEGVIASPVIVPPTPVASVAPKPAPDMNKEAAETAEKVAENAKTVVKNLDSASDAMTLAELNSARQTVARIEAIIDVEKHLAELDKIRNDRNGHVSPSFANAIPASALMPPRPQMVPEFTPPPPPPRVMPKVDHFASIEVTRIAGLDGQYTATLKMDGMRTKTVKAGDHLDGGITIQKITPMAVVVGENGQSHTLHMKGVDVVYSATR